MPVVKLRRGSAVQRAVQDAFPYGFPTSVAESVLEGSQLPHCVVVKSGTKWLRDAYGGAKEVVVVGAGTDVAVRTVSDCVKLNTAKEYDGVAVA